MMEIQAYWRALTTIVWKDLSAEWRTRNLISSMLVFSILIILIFNFALELETRTGAAINSGILWVTLIFAGVTGLNHSMPSEKDMTCLDGLLLAPVDRTVIYFGKAISIWLIMMLVAAILLPLYSILYNTNLFIPGLILTISLGTAGYALSGTLLSSLAMQSRTRDLLLPIVLFPVVFPLLLSAVKASSAFLQALPQTDAQLWVSLLVVFDVLFAGLGLILFDPIMEE
jgi:heme exporter protein B